MFFHLSGFEVYKLWAFTQVAGDGSGFTLSFSKGSNLTISNQKVEIQLQKPFKLIEVVLIKLKSRQIPLEPEKDLFLGSNLPLSYESKLMSSWRDLSQTARIHSRI